MIKRLLQLYEEGLWCVVLSEMFDLCLHVLFAPIKFAFFRFFCEFFLAWFKVYVYIVDKNVFAANEGLWCVLNEILGTSFFVSLKSIFALFQSRTTTVIAEILILFPIFCFFCFDWRMITLYIEIFSWCFLLDLLDWTRIEVSWDIWYCYEVSYKLVF